MGHIKFESYDGLIIIQICIFIIPTCVPTRLNKIWEGGPLLDWTATVGRSRRSVTDYAKISFPFLCVYVVMRSEVAGSTRFVNNVDNVGVGMGGKEWTEVAT
jgi:hypothetical protein